MAAVPIVLDWKVLIRKFKASVKDIHSDLFEHLQHGLMDKFVGRMFSAGLIPDALLSPDMDSNSKYVKVMGQFRSIMNDESLEESERHCCKFLDVLNNMGDIVRSRIAKKLKESWVSDAQSLNIELTRIGKASMHSQEVGSGENDDDFVNTHHKQRYNEMKLEKLEKTKRQLTDDRYFSEAQPSGDDNDGSNKVWAMGSDHLDKDARLKEAMSLFTDLSHHSSNCSLIHVTLSDNSIYYDLEMIREGVQHTGSTIKSRISLDKQRKELESEPMDTQEDQRSDKLCQQQNPDSSSLSITSTHKTSVPETRIDISISSPVREEDRCTGRRRSLSSPAVITNMKFHSLAHSDLNQDKSEMIFPNGLSTTTAAIPASGIRNEVLEKLAEISDRLSCIESRQAENLSVQTQTECCCNQMAKELQEKSKEISDLKSRLEENKTFITQLLDALKRNN